MDAPQPIITVWRLNVYYVFQNVIKLPIIKQQENREGSFSFSVTFDATIPNHILSSTFNGWSNGSQKAVDWGMRVTIDNVENGVTTRLADGIISTISPTESMVTFDCADMMAVLGTKGAELHRNYYNSATYTGYFNAITDGSESADTIAVDITAISNANGVPIDPIKYRVQSERDLSQTHNYVFCQKRSGGSVSNSYEWTFTATNDFDKLTLGFLLSGSTGLCNYYVDFTGPDGLILDHLFKMVGGTVTTTELLAGGVIYPPGQYTVKIYSPTILQIPYAQDPLTDVNVYAHMGSASDGEIVQNGTTSLGYGAMAVYMREYIKNDVTAWNRNGNQLLITAIQGVDISTSKADLIDPAQNRANIPYTAGVITTTEIMSHIKKVAINDSGNAIIDSSAFGNAPTLSLFRTGGGYALDYLRKLADISNSSGRQLSFIIAGTVLRIGARRNADDAATYSVVSGSLDGPLYLVSLDLKKTIKGRPSRAMLRGSLSSNNANKPILAVIRNSTLAASRGDVYTDTVITDSSALTASDMIAVAYSSVNHSDDGWEGTLVLSGIVPDLIDGRGAFAGSGKVIEVTHVQQGVDHKKFKIVAVTYDYEKLTTTLTLTNAPQIYSSDIVESIAESLSAGDMAVSSSGSDLYKTQFVYQYTQYQEMTMTSGNVVKLKTTDNEEITLGDVAVYMLGGGRKLIYGAVTVSTSSNAKYRVSQYSINGGSWKAIQERDRCDAYNGQHVIFNLDCRQ